MKETTPTNEDINDLLLAHRHRLSLTPPRQSFFRVVALIFYELEGDDEDNHNSKRRHVVGANDEPCSIQGSICAERAALLQLRFLPNLKQITKVIIVTDSKDAITPGMLCREYMTSHPKICMEMSIVLGGAVCNGCGMDISGPDFTRQSSLEDLESECNCSNLSTATSSSRISDESTLKSCPHDFRAMKTNLSELFPHPSPYARLCSKTAEELGKLHHNGQMDSKSIMKFYPLARDDHQGMMVQYQGENICVQDAVSRLILLATKACERDIKTSLHPIQYGAAVLFSDGAISSTYQKKALEYGCSLDAVGQLAHVIDEKYHRAQCSIQSSGGLKPILLVQTDQYGVVHAPFAPGRAFLHENEICNDCHVPVQLEVAASLEKKVNAQILLVKASDLAPSAPAIWGPS